MPTQITPTATESTDLALDALTRKATAFPSYAELTADMTRTGYFPTLSRHSKAQRELGRILEAEHRRVFWTR